MSSARRRLIVNADDFGRSAGINAGIAIGHEQGIVTSASLMVRWPMAPAAAAYARAHPPMSVGLHFDLSEWRFDGEWRPVYEVLDDGGREAVELELERQLARFETLIGRPPTHLDSHQHVHREEPVQSLLLAAGHARGVPVRSYAPEITYLGDFYGQWGRGESYPEGITVEHLLELLAALPAGVTELGCHPASVPELESSYAYERPVELAAICDRRVAAALIDQRIELCSFAEAGQSGS
jgi:predicted glycoside hydrolase/deacetylase ChbG (UPF0249 family)